MKKLLFDYVSPVDYNPFGGGFKPKGYWIFNKQKLFNIIMYLIGILCLINIFFI